ncbi:MAG: M20/M25/M40 family metallo-hydrolase [Clostridia bacterium]|nr:M20/M25/M40 family metallo-hydrolase [Clostridia bacterium]
MNVKDYVEKNSEKYNSLLKTFTEIPSWTGGEQKREEFCLNYLKELGYTDVTSDEVGNVICGYRTKPGKANIAFMAHLDTVFDESADYTVKARDNMLFAPGIGDNSVNAVSLLNLAEYVIKNDFEPEKGIYFVFSTGEEGLGNLIGSRTFTEKYKDRIFSFVALDLYYDKIFDTCVGSVRYRVSVETSGGHSYLDFGKKNAIAVLSEILAEVYSGNFDREYLTYNVGNITGGTTVNTIAAKASMLFEFRSKKNSVMNKASDDFMTLVSEKMSDDVKISIEVLGKRPCGEPVCEEEKGRLVESAADAITSTGLNAPIVTDASTDCNIPLSLSIPAVSFGTCMGYKAHTLDEHIEEGSNLKGMEVLLKFFNSYVMEGR